MQDESTLNTQTQTAHTAYTHWPSLAEQPYLTLLLCLLHLRRAKATSAISNDSWHDKDCDGCSGCLAGSASPLKHGPDCLCKTGDAKAGTLSRVGQSKDSSEKCSCCVGDLCCVLVDCQLGLGSTSDISQLGAAMACKEECECYSLQSSPKGVMGPSRAGSTDT
jgi:hypothetical protein